MDANGVLGSIYDPVTRALRISGGGVSQATLDAAIAALSGTYAPLPPAWSTFAPTLSAVTTPPTFGTGSTIIAGSYLQSGKNVVGVAEMRTGTSGFAAGSGNYLLALPVAANLGSDFVNRIVGVGWYYNGDATVSTMTLEITTDGATFARFRNAAGNLINHTGMLSQCQFSYQLNYEAN